MVAGRSERRSVRSAVQGPSVMRGLKVADLDTISLKAIAQQGDALIDNPLVPFGGTDHRR